MVGVGEAAYGSVGIAVVVGVPQAMRATLTRAFMAGGMFGSVLGMGLGRRHRCQAGLALGVCRHVAVWPVVWRCFIR
jgi:hypothetical protein